MAPLMIRGVAVWPGFLGAEAQRSMLADLQGVVAAAPFYRLQTRMGPMSVEMTAAGRFGWFADRAGYRYVGRHPGGAAWPAIPESVMAVWRAVADCPRDPECCLINLYRESG
jgi:DNA oxidative demethylase